MLRVLNEISSEQEQVISDFYSPKQQQQQDP
jgi:hypothetical protein